MTLCRECHEEIWWAITAEGKKYAVNKWTNKSGTIVTEDPESPTPLILIIGKDEPWHGPRYVSHFFTCKAKRKAKKRG